MSAIADATESIDRTVAIFRDLPVRAADAYCAFTDTEALTRWMAPAGLTIVECQCEARENGKFRAILRDGSGTHQVLRGVFREAVPGERLVFTWEPEWDGKAAAPTIVTVEFKEHDGHTELKLTHSVFETLEDRDRHARYWERCLDNLAELLAGQGAGPRL